jgi:hypothetical protein
VTVSDVTTFSLEAVNATVSGTITAANVSVTGGALTCPSVQTNSLAVVPGILLADKTAVTMYGPQVQVGNLLVAGAANITSTGIMLTGGPTTYVNSLILPSAQIASTGNYFIAPTRFAGTVTGGTGSFQSIGVSGTAMFGNVWASTINSTNLLGNTLLVPGAASVTQTGTSFYAGVSGPTGSFQTLLAPNVSGGTGSFETLTAGTGSFGSIAINGTLSAATLWSGVNAIVAANSVPVNWLGSSYSNSYTTQFLGTWTAPLGGAVLKLSYLSCCGFSIGTAVSRSGNVLAGPQIVDFDIYFYTSSQTDYILLSSGARVYGYGYCLSTHVTNFPLAVYVTSNFFGGTTTQVNSPKTFGFYVTTGPSVGNPVVSAVTANTWTPNLNDNAGITIFPSNTFALKIGSRMSTMVQNYASR